MTVTDACIRVVYFLYMPCLWCYLLLLYYTRMFDTNTYCGYLYSLRFNRSTVLYQLLG